MGGELAVARAGDLTSRRRPAGGVSTPPPSGGEYSDQRFSYFIVYMTATLCTAVSVTCKAATYPRVFAARARTESGH
eukprot:2178749-Pleurochrysis_carterae.AAC.11